MGLRTAFEMLETRRLLTFAFTQQFLDLPIVLVGSDMQAGDINQDSHIDLVVGATRNAYVLLGIEGGGFEVAEELQLDGTVQGILGGDLNNDGHHDFVLHTSNGVVGLVNRGDSVGQWLGFEAQPSGEVSSSENVKLGRINDDDFADLVVEAQTEIRIYYGHGDGSFGEHQALPLTQFIPDMPAGPNEPVDPLEPVDPVDPLDPVDPSFRSVAMDVGDLNNDGFDEIVASLAKGTFFDLGGTDYRGEVFFFQSDGSDLFERRLISEELANRSLQLFDMDRDNNLDLILGGPGGDNIESIVLRGLGDGSFQDVEQFPPDRLLGDFRVESSSGQRAHTIRRQDGGGAYFPGGLFIEDGASQYAIDMSPWRGGTTPHFIDIDSDGVDEVVGLVGSRLAVLKRQELSEVEPRPEIVERTTVPFGTASDMPVPAPKFLADFDGDGYVDQAWLQRESWERDDEGQVRYTLRMGVRWGDPDRLVERRVSARDATFYDIVIGDVSLGGSYYTQTTDVDNDGFMDMQFETTDDDTAITLFGSADRAFRWDYTAGTRFTDRSPHFTAEGDIDADGFVDLVTVHDSWLDGLITVQRGISSSEFETEGLTYHFRKGWDYFDIQEESVQLADMTGDGVLDIVYFDDVNPNFYVFRGISSLIAGDVDRDGVANVTDLEELIAVVASGQQSSTSGSKLDWTGDQLVDQRDVDYMVEHIFKTRPGDTNLDGRVDFADFLVLSANFGSEGTWSDGDFDLNSKIDFEDFLILAMNFGVDGVGLDPLPEG